MIDYKSSYLNYKSKYINFLENKKKLNNNQISRGNNMIGGNLAEYLQLYNKLFAKDSPFNVIFDITGNFQNNNKTPASWLKNGNPATDIHYNLSDRIVDIYYKIFCWARDNIPACVVKIPKGAILCRTVDRFNKKQCNTYSLEIPYAKKQKPGVFANTSILGNAQVAVAQPINAVIFLKLVKDIFLFNSWPIMHLFEIHLKSPGHMEGGFLKNSQEHLFTKVCAKMRLNGIIGFDHVENTQIPIPNNLNYFVQGLGRAGYPHTIGTRYDDIMKDNLNRNTNQCFIVYQPPQGQQPGTNYHIIRPNNTINTTNAVVSFPEFLIFNFAEENIWNMISITNEMDSYMAANDRIKGQWSNNIEKLVQGLDQVNYTNLKNRIKTHELTKYDANGRLEYDFNRYENNTMKNGLQGWANDNVYQAWDSNSSSYNITLTKDQRTERFEKSYKSIFTLHNKNRKALHIYDLQIYNELDFATKFGSELTDISGLQFRNFNLDQSLTTPIKNEHVQYYNDLVSRASELYTKQADHLIQHTRNYFGMFNQNISVDIELLSKFNKLCVEITNTNQNTKICDLNKIPDYCGEDGSFADNALIKGDITNYFYESQKFDEKIAETTAQLIADLKFNVNKYTIKLQSVSLQTILKNINIKVFLHNNFKKFCKSNYSIPPGDQEPELENDGLKNFIKNLLHYKEKDKVLTDHEILNLDLVVEKINNNVKTYLDHVILRNNQSPLEKTIYEIYDGTNDVYLDNNFQITLQNGQQKKFNNITLNSAYKRLDNNYIDTLEPQEQVVWEDDTNNLILNEYIERFIDYITEKLSNYKFIYSFSFNLGLTQKLKQTFLNTDYNTLFYGLYLKGGGAFKRLLAKEIKNEKYFNVTTNRFSSWKGREKEKIESVLGSPSDYDLNFIVNTKLDYAEVNLFNKIFNEILYDYMLANKFYESEEPKGINTPYIGLTDYFSNQENKEELRDIILDSRSNKDVIVEVDIDANVINENAFKVEDTIAKRGRAALVSYNTKMEDQELAEGINYNDSKILHIDIVNKSRNAYCYYSKKESVWLSGGIAMLNTHFDLHRLMLSIPIKEVYKDKSNFPKLEHTHDLIKEKNSKRQYILPGNTYDAADNNLNLIRRLSKINTNTSIAQVELIDISTIYKDAYEANSKWQESLNMKSNVTYSVGDWIQEFSKQGPMEMTGDVYEVVNVYSIRNVYDIVKLEVGYPQYYKPTGVNYYNNLVSRVTCIPYNNVDRNKLEIPEQFNTYQYYNRSLEEGSGWSHSIELFSFKAAIKDLNNNIKENLAMGMLKKIKKRQKRVAFLAQLEYIFITHTDPYIFDNKEDSGPFSLLIFNNYLDHYKIDKEKGLTFLKDINNILIIKLENLNFTANNIFYETGSNKNEFINPIKGCSFDELIKLRTFYQSLFTIIYNRINIDKYIEQTKELYNNEDLVNIIKLAYNNICQILSIPFYINESNNNIGKKQESNLLIFLLNIFSLLLEEEYNLDYDVYLKKNSKIYIILYHLVNNLYYVLAKWSLNMNFDFAILESNLTKIYSVLSDFDNYYTAKQNKYHIEAGNVNQLIWIDYFYGDVKNFNTKIIINSKSFKDLEKSIEKSNVEFQNYSDIIIDFKDENEYKEYVKKTKNLFKNMNYNTMPGFPIKVESVGQSTEYHGFYHYNDDLKLLNVTGTFHKPDTSNVIDYEEEDLFKIEEISTDYQLGTKDYINSEWGKRLFWLNNNNNLKEGADIIYTTFDFMKQLINLDHYTNNKPVQLTKLTTDDTYYKICNIKLTLNKFESNDIINIQNAMEPIIVRLLETDNTNSWVSNPFDTVTFLNNVFSKYSKGQSVLKDLLDRIFIQSQLTYDLINKYDKLNKGYNIFEKRKLLNEIINIKTTASSNSNQNDTNMFKQICGMLLNVRNEIQLSKKIHKDGETNQVYITNLQQIDQNIAMCYNILKDKVQDQTLENYGFTQIDDYMKGTISNLDLDLCIERKLTPGVEPGFNWPSNLQYQQLPSIGNTSSSLTGTGGILGNHGHQTPFKFGSTNQSIGTLNQNPSNHMAYSPAVSYASPLLHSHPIHYQYKPYLGHTYANSPIVPVFSTGMYN